jgi:hypothetical protein
MPSQQPNISKPALQASLAHAAKWQCPKGTQGAVLARLETTFCLMIPFSPVVSYATGQFCFLGCRLLIYSAGFVWILGVTGSYWDYLTTPAWLVLPRTYPIQLSHFPTLRGRYDARSVTCAAYCHRSLALWCYCDDAANLLDVVLDIREQVYLGDFPVNQTEKGVYPVRP